MQPILEQFLEKWVWPTAPGAGRRFPLAPHGGEVPQGLGGRAAQFAQ